jgi:hypothetical protein
MPPSDRPSEAIPPLNQATMDDAWERAKVLIRAQGDDPDEMVRRAAENIERARSAEAKVCRTCQQPGCAETFNRCPAEAKAPADESRFWPTIACWYNGLPRSVAKQVDAHLTDLIGDLEEAFPRRERATTWPSPDFTRDEVAVVERVCKLLSKVWNHFQPNSYTANDCFCRSRVFDIEHFQHGQQSIAWLEALVDRELTLAALDSSGAEPAHDAKEKP